MKLGELRFTSYILSPAFHISINITAYMAFGINKHTAIVAV
jgi:hypothetical protein